MFCMTRKFNSVGQGLFCTERFKSQDRSVNLIYDCGSSSPGPKHVEEVISANFDTKNGAIDCVFISHFDQDHINGIPFLIDNYTVRKIYLPRFSDAYEIAYWWITGYIRSDRYGRLLQEIINQYEEHTATLINSRGERVPIEWIYESIAHENNVLNNIDIGLQYCDVIGCCDWVIIPFIFKSDRRACIFNQVFDEIAKEYFKLPNANKFIRSPELYLKRLGKKIRSKLLADINQRLRMYFSREHAGDVNSNSVVLYSGPRSEDRIIVSNKTTVYNGYSLFHPYPLVGKRIWEQRTIQHAGCLYMGDYDASIDEAWNDLVAYYKLRGCWSNIGCVQIPHHGSYDNFTTELVTLNADLVVSYGINNQYRHPHWETRQILKRSICSTYYVNEHFSLEGKVCFRNDCYALCHILDVIRYGSYSDDCNGCSMKNRKRRRLG